MEHYSKPSLTYELQLGKLEERGMIIEDRDLARFYLQHVSYYRLSGYFYHLYQDDSHQQFKADTRFSNIIRAYNADKALRLALLNATHIPHPPNKNLKKLSVSGFKGSWYDFKILNFC